MAKRTKMVGTGIAARELTVMPDPAEWNSAHEAGRGAFGAVTLALVEECRQILADARDADAPDGFAEVASQLLDLHHAVSTDIRHAKADSAARFAFALGAQYAAAAIAEEWDAHALRGQKILAGAADGGRGRRGINSARNVCLARDYLEARAASAVPSRTHLMATIGRRAGLQRSAAIAAINDGLKISSGEQAKPDRG